MSNTDLNKMKKLDDMRVVELRAELEKRNLDKTGIKAVLVERLKSVIGEEGTKHLVCAATTEQEMPEECEASDSRQTNGDHVPEQDEENDYEPEASTGLEHEETAEQLLQDMSSTGTLHQHFDGDENDELLLQDVGETIDEQPQQDEVDVDTDEENQNTSVDEASKGEQQQQQQQEQFGQLVMQESEDYNTEDVDGAGSEQQQQDAKQSDEANQLLSKEQFSSTTFSEAKKDDEYRGSTTNNIEDAINFMLDEDDNMLEDEMIYEDGTTNRISLDDCSGAENKADSEQQVHHKTNNSANSATDGSSSGKSADTAGAESRDNATDDQHKNNDKSESSNKKSSSASCRGDSASKDPKDSGSGGSSNRSLWVSGLASSTRAQHLKSHFSKHGKVSSAKIVTSAKTPGSKCFGFVTMGNTEEASKCIKLLNKTELHGRIILVEQAKGETAAGSAGNSSSHNKSGDSGSDGKRDKSGRRVDSRRRSADIKRGDKTEGRRSGGSSRERDRRARVIDHRYGAPRPMRGALGNRHSSGKEDRRSPSKTGDSRRVPIARRLSPRLGGGVVSPRRLSPLIDRRETLPRRHDKEMLGLTHIIEERERERLRARDRQMREEERRAREDEARQRMIERRQREEAERLHREREQLRAERERIERQKQELLRLEREQQRMEREKLEREREELRRQQIKLSHTDRVSKTIGSRYDQRGSRSLKRSATDDRGSGRAEAFYDDRKRPAHDRGAMPVDTRARYEDPLHSRTRYESSRDVHRYDSSSSSNIHTSYARDALVRESSSSSRYDRHSTGLPVTPTATASASKSSHSTDDLRWLSGAQPAPISNSRRSDGYYDDRRGDSRSSAVATTSDGRVLREYHHGAPAVLAPPAPLISSRSSDSSSRVSRDSGKGIYSSSMSSSDVWRTGSSSSKTSTYGSSSGSKSIYGSSGSKSMYGSTSSSSSSKNVYGSSAVSGSSSKGVYSGASNGTGGLLASHHEGGTWRGSVSNAGASSSSSGGRWSDTRNSSSNNNNNNNSGGGGGGGGSNGSASVKMADYARDTLINYNSSSSSSSHHPTLQTMQSAAQDTRDYALSSSSSYRKY